MFIGFNKKTIILVIIAICTTWGAAELLEYLLEDMDPGANRGLIGLSFAFIYCHIAAFIFAMVIGYLEDN